MAEERVKSQEEAILREMREAEEEAARKAKQASICLFLGVFSY